MKKTLLLTLLAVAFGSVSMAKQCPQVQSYAHPTLFGSDAAICVGAKADTVVGGKITKCSKALTVNGKENVVIKRFVKDELDKMAANCKCGKFCHKTPVLRSELALTLADGLSLATVKEVDKYSDVPSGYWAKQQIDEALAADIMIGYPDGTFKPEQRVTKAEVFCTLAKVFDVNYGENVTPKFNGKVIKHIPDWASAATNEVLATGILANIPDEKALINNEYFTKEQVAYLVGALSAYIKSHPECGTAALKCASPKYEMLIRLEERLSARTSNAGDTFTAVLVEPATLGDVTVPAGAKVKGIVACVVRPGVGNPGFIKVQFKEVKYNNVVTPLPEAVVEVSAETVKDANILARLVGAPLSLSARVLGVAGRSVTQEAGLIANGVETYGDNWSNAFCDTFSLQPMAGLKNAGRSFVTVGKFVWNTAETAVSGVFGVGYECVDELRYLVAPKYSNSSSLNPKEVLKVTFK